MNKALLALTKLRVENFQNWPQPIPVANILRWFEICEAVWLHNGNPKAPHAELTSGKCSNGFFDCSLVLSYLNLSDILAHQLARKIRLVLGDQPIDWVIASPMAGITFGHDVAKALGAKRMFFTEKDPDAKGKDKGRMLWRLQIPAGETVLQVEELITTAKTLNAVKDAVDLGNDEPVNWLPFVGTLVHRPDQLPRIHYGDRLVIPMIEKAVWAVDQVDCPLCDAGSSRYRPKQGNNWEILNVPIK